MFPRCAPRRCGRGQRVGETLCEVVQDVCDIIQRLWTEVIDPILTQDGASKDRLFRPFITVFRPDTMAEIIPFTKPIMFSPVPAVQ